MHHSTVGPQINMVCLIWLRLITVAALLMICIIGNTSCFAFTSISNNVHSSRRITKSISTQLNAQISEQEAKVAIDKVVKALQKDRQANEEMGRLSKTNNILGFGSPRAGIIAVRFNASFQKGGMGRSSIPLPFGLGQSNKSEGRGTMVGQVKASVDAKTGKILSCSVFRDLGYGRSFNLKV